MILTIPLIITVIFGSATINLFETTLQSKSTLIDTNPINSRCNQCKQNIESILSIVTRFVVIDRILFDTSHHIPSYYATFLYIISYPFISYHIPSYHIPWYHITFLHIPSYPITSHPFISHSITSLHIP